MFQLNLEYERFRAGVLTSRLPLSSMSEKEILPSAEVSDEVAVVSVVTGLSDGIAIELEVTGVFLADLDFLEADLLVWRVGVTWVSAGGDLGRFSSGINKDCRFL